LANALKQKTKAVFVETFFIIVLSEDTGVGAGNF